MADPEGGRSQSVQPQTDHPFSDRLFIYVQNLRTNRSGRNERDKPTF